MGRRGKRNQPTSGMGRRVQGSHKRPGFPKYSVFSVGNQNMDIENVRPTPTVETRGPEYNIRILKNKNYL